MDLGLGDRVAVGTSAGSDIGQAIAFSLAAEGARLVAADLNGDSAAATAAEVGKSGVETLFLASGGASQVTGQTISVSGGYSMV